MFKAIHLQDTAGNARTLTGGADNDNVIIGGKATASMWFAQHFAIQVMGVGNVAIILTPQQINGLRVKHIGIHEGSKFVRTQQIAQALSSDTALLPYPLNIKININNGIRGKSDKTVAWKLAHDHFSHVCRSSTPPQDDIVYTRKSYAVTTTSTDEAFGWVDTHTGSLQYISR